MIYLCILMLFLSACASPQKIRVRNCKAVGYNLYECDPVIEPETGPHRGM